MATYQLIFVAGVVQGPAEASRGYKTIPLDKHVAFQKRHLLRGSDEPGHFTAEMLSQIASLEQVSVEPEARQLIYYRDSRALGEEKSSVVWPEVT